MLFYVVDLAVASAVDLLSRGFRLKAEGLAIRRLPPKGGRASLLSWRLDAGRPGGLLLVVTVTQPDPSTPEPSLGAEARRLEEARQRARHWKRWGPYLSERAWGTVREDYSADGTAWEYFPHDHARSRAYRWNEDGIAGICDRHQRICFALALWNGRDPILKERLFGLTGNEGNHGEDVKEYYFYLDSTPTHSYMRYLYKYPQAEFPYDARRGEPPPRAD